MLNLIVIKNCREILLNNRNEAYISGIVSAGDVIGFPEKQTMIAAEEGTEASLSA